MTFLHRLKKILAINYKKAQCYDNAWLFVFKVSHHTSLSVNYSGRSLNFPPTQSTFEISLGKASSDQARGVHISQPPSITSGVLLRCAVHLVSRHTHFLCKLHETLCNKSIWEFRKEKINTLDHYPTPYPPLPAVRSACSDCRLSRLTIQLV